MKKNRALLI